MDNEALPLSALLHFCEQLFGNARWPVIKIQRTKVQYAGFKYQTHIQENKLTTFFVVMALICMYWVGESVRLYVRLMFRCPEMTPSVVKTPLRYELHSHDRRSEK